MLVLLVATVLLGLHLSSPWRGQRIADALHAESSGPVYTTTVDWYKPPPDTWTGAEYVEIPHQLLAPVPEALREEATALLGEEDSVALTTEKAARFASAIDPKAVLQSNIQEKTQELRSYQDHPLNETDVLKRYGADELKEEKLQRHNIMKRLASEIERSQQWENQLRPYLIKAVVLKAGGYFGGAFFSDDLLVHFEAMGSKAAPMERRPVIAFLPKKPRTVYTEVGMME